MCIEEAIAIVENNKRWGTPEINRNMGFVHRAPWIHGATGTHIIGEMRIQSRPKMHNAPLFHERGIQIFWGFDADGKLIEVHVHVTIAPRLA